MLYLFRVSVGAMALVIFSYNTAKVYGQTSRDLRRLSEP